MSEKKNKQVWVGYTCPKESIQRYSRMEDELSYIFLLWIRDHVDRCEAKNGPCPDYCTMKQQLLVEAEKYKSK